MDKQNGKAVEQVVCGICGTEYAIKAWDSILCKCKARIFSTPELQAKVAECEAKALALKVEAGELLRELHYREKRRVMKDPSGKPLSDAEFWKNVHGKPKEVAEKVAKASRLRVQKGNEALL